MDMAKRFVLLVTTEDGQAVSARMLDNSQLDLFECEVNQLPDYVHERIALIMLCDVNNRKEGEIHGRRRSENTLLVYLSYEEYYEILGVHKND
jgi:hypothetical protein